MIVALPTPFPYIRALNARKDVPMSSSNDPTNNGPQFASLDEWATAVEAGEQRAATTKPAAAPAPTNPPANAPATNAPAARTPVVDPHAAERRAAIDRMIEALSTSRSDMTLQQNPQQGMSVNTESGIVEVRGPAPQSIEGADDERISDSGVDTGWARAQIERGVAEVQAKLDEFTFDQKTGAKLPVVTGRARDVLQLQLNQARQSAAFNLDRLSRLEAQRATDSQRSQATNNEALARAAYVAGSPARAKLLDEALSRAEADQVAAAILNARKVGRRG